MLSLQFPNALLLPARKYIWIMQIQQNFHGIAPDHADSTEKHRGDADFEKIYMQKEKLLHNRMQKHNKKNG
jgi:hypothetical protein